jgi:hypothetical protein
VGSGWLEAGARVGVEVTPGDELVDQPVRFVPLPATILQRIEAADDPERLQVCIEHVSALQSLQDLAL